jgi:hypothetical protein
LPLFARQVHLDANARIRTADRHGSGPSDGEAEKVDQGSWLGGTPSRRARLYFTSPGHADVEAALEPSQWLEIGGAVLSAQFHQECSPAHPDLIPLVEMSASASMRRSRWRQP